MTRPEKSRQTEPPLPTKVTNTGNTPTLASGDGTRIFSSRKTTGLSPDIAPIKPRREVPSTLIYWSLGAALGALLLGFSTIPYRSSPYRSSEPAPRSEIIASEETPAMDEVANRATPIAVTSPDEQWFIIVLDPEVHYVAAPELEKTLKAKLARHGFPNIGVSVGRQGGVYLAGTLSDQSEQPVIQKLVRGTDGVTMVHFSDVEVRKSSGPAYFGAETARIPNQPGAAVTKVYPGSPADLAGIHEGDVIVRFGEDIIRDQGSLRAILRSPIGGQRVAVTLSRNGQPETVIVRLATLLASSSPPNGTVRAN